MEKKKERKIKVDFWKKKEIEKIKVDRVGQTCIRQKKFVGLVTENCLAAAQERRADVSRRIFMTHTWIL